MRIILALVFITLTTASRIHFTPATTNVYIVRPSTTASERQYHEQDSRGFYSYGYSGDSSAKAEYTARDGSSRGFYSYIDAEGKLQTVKYEAGRKQGFTASATNLPKVPVDDGQAPAPVEDTLEVQMAKKAHFEAHRDAEMRTALLAEMHKNAEAAESNEASDEEQQLRNLSQSELDEAVLQHSREQYLAAVRAQNNEQQASDSGVEDDMRNGAGDTGDGGENSSDDENIVLQDLSNVLERRPNSVEDGVTGGEDNGSATRAHREMTTYRLNEQRLSKADLPHLRTIYSLADDRSTSILRLSADDQRSLGYLQPTTKTATTIESVRVPVNSYYTVLAPSTEYTVATPTIYATVPHAQSPLRLGNSLPISLSTSFSSHRINGKLA